MEFSNKLIQAFSWLFAAQLLSRISRLMTTLVVARLLSPEHFGLVAIALATNELANVVARFGSTAALVQCDSKVLQERCKTAWSINWVLGIGLFLIQCGVAIPVAHWYDSPELVMPIVVLALSYLLLPLAQVNVALTLRRNDMRSVAKAEVLQSIADMLLTVTLAFAGFGLWALILPKVVVIPIWIYIHKTVSPWKPTGFSLFNYKPLLAFSYRVMGVEVLNVVRHNIDYILIGAFLGIEALGIYFFAFNAGLGITKGVITALSNALYPNLCEQQRSLDAINSRFRQGLKVIGLVVVAVVALQTSLAEYYVPIVFGTKWVDYGALPILITICLSAVPIAFVEAGSQYLRARGLPQRDLRWHLPFTVVFTLAILIGAQWGIEQVAIAILIVHLINLPFYYLFNLVPAMRDHSDIQENKHLKELTHA